MGLHADRCPFLALSATVGNPEQVTEWLQSVKCLQLQQDQAVGTAAPSGSYSVKLIQHGERYADLRYHSFQPAAMQSGNDCLDVSSASAADAQAAFRKIHPCAVVTAQQLQEGGFPSEITLEPCDCLGAVHRYACRTSSSSHAL